MKLNIPREENNEKTAKEMLEDLGYHLIKYQPEGSLPRIVYKNESGDTFYPVCHLEFKLDEKSFNLFVPPAGYVESIHMPLLKAIIQQCKELGWM